MADEVVPIVQFMVDGRQVEVADEGITLLEALRDRLGVVAVKDGCAPQGQCGCCTVWIDGDPRVSCVTPLRRAGGRSIVTLDGLDAGPRAEWADALCATGGSQCGFCTPGIVMRLESLRRRDRLTDPVAVERGLAAHLCRCTGWTTIEEAAAAVAAGSPPASLVPPDRDLDEASRRATIEGHAAQRVDPDIPLGLGGFGDDGAPMDAAVAVIDVAGRWHVADTMAEARRAASRIQGRNTTADVRAPLELPEGEWALTLRTSWVEPAALEPDASWCLPGGEPSSPLANGGAFGSKEASPLPEVARRLAEETGRAVRARWTREDTVRHGPKRPPMAIGLRADGSGVARVVVTEGIAGAIASAAPDVVVEQIDLPGPPTSAALRAAGWAELAAMRAVLVAGADGPIEVTSPDGATATARWNGDALDVSVRCGRVLDATVLRSYCIGAAHMALGWVRSEGLAVDEDGEVHDLTIRSFGIVRPADMAPVNVEIIDSDADPVNGSDAVFAAVAAATWRADGLGPTWPTQPGRR